MVAGNKICLPVGGGCWLLETLHNTLRGVCRSALETGNKSCGCWALGWNTNDDKIQKKGVEGADEIW